MSLLFLLSSPIAAITIILAGDHQSVAFHLFTNTMTLLLLFQILCSRVLRPVARIRRPTTDLHLVSLLCLQRRQQEIPRPR